MFMVSIMVFSTFFQKKVLCVYNILLCIQCCVIVQDLGVWKVESSIVFEYTVNKREWKPTGQNQETSITLSTQDAGGRQTKLKTTTQKTKEVTNTDPYYKTGDEPRGLWMVRYVFVVTRYLLLLFLYSVSWYVLIVAGRQYDYVTILYNRSRGS